jgi:hypothetical protein
MKRAGGAIRKGKYSNIEALSSKTSMGGNQKITRIAKHSGQLVFILCITDFTSALFNSMVGGSHGCLWHHE